MKKQIDWILVAIIFDFVLIGVLTIMLIGSFIQASSL